MTDEINLYMTPTQVPAIAREHRPDTRVLDIGPPRGMTEAECGTVQALLGRIGGYPAVADYWTPTAEHLGVLNAGGFIELVQYVPQMIMHSMSVWPASVPPDADAVEAFAEALLGTPTKALAAAAATLVDSYATASWTQRTELIDALRDALADYIRDDA